MNKGGRSPLTCSLSVDIIFVYGLGFASFGMMP
jgi:hypothetical protein